MSLVAYARSQSPLAALSRRAQIGLRLVDGETGGAIARRYRVVRPTMSLRRNRFAEYGIAGMHDELKPRCPSGTGEDEIANLIDAALTRTLTSKTDWSRPASSPRRRASRKAWSTGT